MIVLFDVDGTVVNTPELWLEWISKETDYDFPIKKMNYYESFETEIQKIKNRQDLYNFWRNENLYDVLTPYQKAIKLYNDFKNKGYKVLFVSHSNIFPEHIRSKKMFLRKFFPEHDGFISTDKKEMVKGDMLIDDSPNHLLKFKEHNPDSVVILSQQFYNSFTKDKQSTEDLFSVLNFRV